MTGTCLFVVQFYWGSQIIGDIQVSRIRKQHGQLHQEAAGLLHRSQDWPLLCGLPPGHLLSLSPNIPKAHLLSQLFLQHPLPAHPSMEGTFDYSRRFESGLELGTDLSNCWAGMALGRGGINWSISVWTWPLHRGNFLSTSAILPSPLRILSPGIAE